MMQAFSRRIPAQEALNNFCKSIKSKLENNDTPYLVATSQDTRKIKGASGDYTPTNKLSVKALNKELREPLELVMFPGGVRECTIND